MYWLRSLGIRQSWFLVKCLPFTVSISSFVVVVVQSVSHVWPFVTPWTSTISYVHSLQSCLTLCDCMDCSLPGSSVHGILQARILKWVAMPSSRRSSQLRDQTCKDWTSISLCLLHWQADSLPLVLPAKSNCLLKCAQILVYWITDAI